jgi:hypothetical protein
MSCGGVKVIEFEMNEEAAVNQVAEEDLNNALSDEALEAAGENTSRPAWTNICTGIQCPG